MIVTRFNTNPIIHMETGSDLEGNINGPSLIKTPTWLDNPLGKYYLYFAHHIGSYIRLAYSDNLNGPWSIYEPGTLQLNNAYCYNHIASPDVHIDDNRQEIRMYYHGMIAKETQRTKIALSKDGINFKAYPEILGTSYFRVFKWDKYYYAIGMPGNIYRSKDGLTDFEQGPSLFTKNMRHCALKLEHNMLKVFYTNAFDTPEVIYMASIELSPNWHNWKESKSIIILEPEMKYEGADMPIEPSKRGAIMEKARQLRDPAIFEDNNKTYLLYSVAGEQGIAIARIDEG